MIIIFFSVEKLWQWPPRIHGLREAPWSSGQSGPHPPPLSHYVSQLVSLREHEEKERDGVTGSDHDLIKLAPTERGV